MLAVGLGPRLTRTVEEFAAGKGMKKIALSTLGEMDLARKLYEKCGFTLFKELAIPVPEVTKMLGDGEWDELVVVHYQKQFH